MTNDIIDNMKDTFDTFSSFTNIGPAAYVSRVRSLYPDSVSSGPDNVAVRREEDSFRLRQRVFSSDDTESGNRPASRHLNLDKPVVAV